MKGVVTTPILAAVLGAMFTGSGVVAAAAFFAVIAIEIAVITGALRNKPTPPKES